MGTTVVGCVVSGAAVVVGTMVVGASWTSIVKMSVVVSTPSETAI